MPATVKVFVSYSHQDSEYLEDDSLLGFLKGLGKQGVEIWTDRNLRGGELWEEVIKTKLRACDIALALVSQAFLDSKYCQDVEIKTLLAQQTHLFPVILSPCDWQEHEWLRSRHFLPNGNETIEEHYLDSGRRKRLFLEARKQLHKWVQSIRQVKPQSSSLTASETRPGVALSTKQKLVFFEGLGESRRSLAEYFDLPLSRQNGFTPGQEARQLWEWLAQNNRLGELPEALEYIGREDLVAQLFPAPLPAAPVGQAAWRGSPYPGLRHFRMEDAPIFFGRDLETKELLRRLGDPVNRFLAVVGASGFGKSSLVAAGVIPRLDAIPGGADWLWLRFTPGGLSDNPFLALAAKLEPLLEPHGWQGRDIADLLYAKGELAELAAKEWEINDFHNAFLWPDERLKPARQMVERLRPNLSEVEQEFLHPEIERLVAELEELATKHHRRAAIGDRMEIIGGTRPGVGLREDGLPEFVWRKVPGGSITLGGNAGTFTVEPFYISKYPMTYIQYRSFPEAEDGYRNKRWWQGLAEREDKPGKQFWKLDNHPAENVSWYDAVAFCRWLTAHLGYEIRLPTEWEWQQAATGGNPANEYPWGKDWNSTCANTEESGLSRMTAVGLYPQGISLVGVGVLDMSGNVDEWCLNEY